MVLFLTSIYVHAYTFLSYQLCSQSLELVEFCHYNLSLCICYLSLNKTITTLFNSVQKSLSATNGDPAKIRSIPKRQVVEFNRETFENALHKGNCAAAMATPSDSSECHEQLLKALSSGIARGVATGTPAPSLLKESLQNLF